MPATFPNLSPSSNSQHDRSPPRTSTLVHHTIPYDFIDVRIQALQSILSKWDSEPSRSLFCDDRQDAKEYMKSVQDLHDLMKLMVNTVSTSHNLFHLQNLVHNSAKRLEKEFYQILAANRDSFETTDSGSTRFSVSELEDDTVLNTESGGPSIAVEDLRGIADCMISTGYGNECMKIFKIGRKSIVNQGLYNLKVEKLSASQVCKMDWQVLETNIKLWLHAVKSTVKTLFYRERILCDGVFASSDSTRESCFTDISRDGAVMLFEFPKHVAKCRKSPEKMFRLLDMYEAIFDLWPEIESIFYFDSTEVVRSHAMESLIKLSESIRTMMTDFEALIQKDSSKSTVRGGGVHPLTRYVMNYLSLLADYRDVLPDIFGDSQSSSQYQLPESYFKSPISGDSPACPMSIRVAWVVLVLLCKIDSKVDMYREVSLSCIFLANNLQYIINKVEKSNLRFFLGEDWITSQGVKVKQYCRNYERVGWVKVFESLKDDPTVEISDEEAKQRFKKFNDAFEEAYSKMRTWVVADPKMREEMKGSIGRKLGTAYRGFYEKCRPLLRRDISFVVYSPDDLVNYLWDLFNGVEINDSSHSHSHSHSHSGWGGSYT